MRRVNVIGSSCAGKSTFAMKLASKLGVPHVDLDALNWEPGWVEAGADEFRRRVGAAAAQERWVADGNYAHVRDLLWPRVDTIIWLDYSFALVMSRASRRTWRRVFRGEACCNGNRENAWRTFSHHSILLWIIRTHGRRRREFRKVLPGMALRGVKVIIFRTPAAAERWLCGVSERDVTV